MSVEYQMMMFVMMLITMTATLVVAVRTGGDDMEKEHEHDSVNHPAHYERENAIECIDEMVEVFGSVAVMHFCLCNVWKYRYRSADKNGKEDISKSDWYMRKYRELKAQHHEEMEKAFSQTDVIPY